MNKNSLNNLDKDSIALVFQLQAVDKKRLIKKIGETDTKTLRIIEEKIRDLFKI